MFRRTGEWAYVNRYSPGGSRRDVVYYPNEDSGSLIDRISISQTQLSPFHYRIDIRFADNSEFSNFVFSGTQSEGQYWRKSFSGESKEEFQSIDALINILVKDYQLPIKIGCELKIDLELRNTQEKIIEELNIDYINENLDFFIRKIAAYKEAIEEDHRDQRNDSLDANAIIQLFGQLESDKSGLASAIKFYSLISDPQTAYHIACSLFDRNLEVGSHVERYEYALKLAFTSADKQLIKNIFQVLCQPEEAKGLHEKFDFDRLEIFNYSQLLVIAEALRKKNQVILDQKREIEFLSQSQPKPPHSSIAAGLTLGNIIKSADSLENKMDVTDDNNETPKGKPIF